MISFILRILHFITLLDRDVEIVIRPKAANHPAGLVSVLVAARTKHYVAHEQGRIASNTNQLWPSKRYAFEVVHETAGDLHRLGFIDKRKMNKFDAGR